MAYSATVFNVLIASPSDVNEEREAIAQTVHDWNALNASETGKVLLPVRWESHSAPAMGDRPQGIINNQVVRDCDILIGAFWTRLGSPTGVEESGTVEEIKLFLKQGKPVMLYYSKKPVDMDTADLDQVKSLKAFKASIRDKGIQEQYNNLDELRQKLMRQLTIVMRGISVGTQLDEDVVKEAKRDQQPTAKASAQALGKNGAGKKLRLLDYTEKSFVVIGDSTEFKDTLKAMNGKWMRIKTSGAGWMFAKRHLQEVADVLGIKAVLVSE